MHNKKYKMENTKNIEDLENILKTYEITLLALSKKVFKNLNRIKKYRKRLLKEALSYAKQNNILLKILPCDSKIPKDKNVVNLYQVKENVCVEDLLELVKPFYPSLYRKYVNAQEAYQKEKNKMKNTFKNYLILQFLKDLNCYKATLLENSSKAFPLKALS